MKNQITNKQLFCTTSTIIYIVSTCKNRQFVPIFSPPYPVNCSNPLLICTRGHPGTDMSPNTIPVRTRKLITVQKNK